MIACDAVARVRRDLDTVRYMMQWHITNRCNLRCQHCYQDKYGGNEPSLTGLLEILGQFRDFLTQHRLATGFPGLRGYVTLVGGEPLARRDFFDLVAQVSALREELSFAVLTNGDLIDEPAAERLASYGPGYVQVSLDGGPATHDAIRGQGQYERAIVALRRLSRHGVRTMVAFTAHAGNFLEFDQVALAAAEVGVARVWADRMIPVNKGGGLRSVAMTREQTQSFVASMASVRERVAAIHGGRTEVAMNRALQFLSGGGEPYRCTAGDTLFAVMPNGDLYPCRRMPVRVGNVFEQPLTSLYEQGIFRALREQCEAPATCRKCSHVAGCGGGLRCLSYAVYGDEEHTDVGCWVVDTVQGEAPY